MNIRGHEIDLTNTDYQKGEFFKKLHAWYSIMKQLGKH